MLSTHFEHDERLVPLRLQKFLARAGVASRRGSESLMSAGRVSVNGKVVTELGSKVDPRIDTVTVDGQIVTHDDEPSYLILHKLSGYLTTMDDPQGRPTVRELVPDDIPGLFPVGRLDLDTTGLLLFTTDGDLSFRLLHPTYHVDKRYEAIVEDPLSEADLDRLRAGITLDDGPCKPAVATLLSQTATEAHVEISIQEGRKRQVKRMFAEIGHPVRTLHRVSFGPLLLGELPLGETRELTAEEIAALRAATGETDTATETEEDA